MAPVLALVLAAGGPRRLGEAEQLPHSGRFPVPIDVDTREDYERLLAAGPGDGS